MRPMTMRERMLAVLHGHEHDRVPLCTYGGMEGLPFDEITALLGPNRWGQLRYSTVHRVTYPHCRFESEDYTGCSVIRHDGPIHEAVGLKFPRPTFAPGKRWQRNRMHTPAGTLTEERVFEPEYDSSTARKHFVETRQDYEVLWSLLADAVIQPDYDRFLREDLLAGDHGMAMAWIERTPYQQLWVEWVGLDNLSLHLMDCPTHVFRTMDLLRQRARQISRSPSTRRRPLSKCRTISPPRPSVPNGFASGVCPSTTSWPICWPSVEHSSSFTWTASCAACGTTSPCRGWAAWTRSRPRPIPPPRSKRQSPAVPICAGG